MNPTPRIFGLIPAAGLSRRMGRPKLALSLGDRTVLERVIEAVRQAGVDPVLVVLGPQVAPLQSLATGAGAEVLLLAEETPDMRATIEQGLSWLEKTRDPSPGDYWLLLPADHPTLDQGIVTQLVASLAENPGGGVLVPTYQGKRGHPTLVAWRHIAAIRELVSGKGLNAFFRGGVEVLEIPVESPEILADLDTPEDYARLQQRWR